MANSNPMQNGASFEEVLNNQEAFLMKNRKMIIGIVVAVIAIIAAVIVYNNAYAQPRENKASTALAKAQALFASEQFDKALKGDEGFIAIADNYSGTDAANLANLYAGLCYANLGKWEDAVKYLDDYSTEDDAIISPASQAALGNAYAQTGNIDKAISCLKKAADMADSKAADGVSNSISPACLIQAARLLESQNKNDEALELYKTVKEKYVNSGAAQEIDKYIERLSK